MPSNHMKREMEPLNAQEDVRRRWSSIKSVFMEICKTETANIFTKMLFGKLLFFFIKISYLCDCIVFLFNEISISALISNMGSIAFTYKNESFGGNLNTF